MLLDLGRSFSFLASLLSLCSLLLSTCFEPSAHWPDRILFSLSHAAVAAACCFFSGYLFLRADSGHRKPAYGSGQAIFSTLPVRMYFYALGGVALLLVGSWFLQTYYVPLLWKNQPYKF